MISHLGYVRKAAVRSHVIWALVAILGWTGRQIWEWKYGGLFSLVVFLKGFLLLMVVSMTYGAACRRRPSFLLLGFFPLLWLSTSRTQWEICIQPDNRYWVWIMIFVVSEWVLFFVKDGRKLLITLGFLWTTLLAIFPFSLFNFFSFGWFRDGSFLKKAKWVCWGLPLVGLDGFFVLKSWRSFQFFWYDLYQVLLSDHFIAFLFLGFLGMVSFLSRKKFWLPAFGPLFSLPLGYLWLAKPDLYSPFIDEILKWVLIFFAGFGWESFRRDVMDRSWHGRLLWFFLGLAFWGGII